MKFTIQVKEMHECLVEIEADTYKEAVEKVQEGEGNASDTTEYLWTKDPEFWSGTDENGKFYDGIYQ